MTIWELINGKRTVKGIKEEALIEFSEERYEAFFISNPEMHLNTLEIMAESKKLLDNQHHSASVIVVFATRDVEPSYT